MQFKLNITTSGGGKRIIEQEATSVQDAIIQVGEIYKGCTINKVDLIPKEGYVRIYDNGEQIEAKTNSIYVPFFNNLA